MTAPGIGMDDWEKRYWADECVHGREPTDFLVENLALLPRGRALDLAMGEGRNAVFLAEQGYEVSGVDRSETAVRRAREWASHWSLPLDARVADLDQETLPTEAFDLIVVVNFLQRALFEPIMGALRPSGAVVYETYTKEHLRYRSMNQDFLLEPNELLRRFAPLHVVLYRELDQPMRKQATASLIAVKR